MEMKLFKSRLFNRTIQPNTLNYWNYVHAELLFRIKQYEDLKCPCGSCFSEKLTLQHLLVKLEDEDKIRKNKRPTSFTNIGDCGRSVLPPRA